MAPSPHDAWHHQRMMRLAWRFALRDLKGGPRGLFIVLLCLTIGVAPVAGIGSLRAALDQGIAQSGRAILGGDLELSTGFGPFPPGVTTWFKARGVRVSATVDTRSILIGPSGRRLLAAVRAVGPDWPLLGQVTTLPAGQFTNLARGADGRPGLLLDPSAAATLALHPGDTVTLGGVALAFRGVIAASPDSLGDTALFGAKTFVAEAALAGTPLVAPSPLVSFGLQIVLPAGATESSTLAAFQQKFPGNVWRVRKAHDATSELNRFVDQATLFMTLLGLAGLLVGGIGVANGVEAWLSVRARSIATLRCLGASANLISLTHGLQLLLLSVASILLGLAIGAMLPLAVLPLLRHRLPLPAHIGLYPGALLLAAIFGLLVGLVFSLRPLRRAAAVSGAALFRRAELPGSIAFSWRATTAQLLAAAAFIILAAGSAQNPVLVLGFCAGTLLTLGLLRGIAALLMRLLPLLPEPQEPARAFGLRRLYGPASSLTLMLLSAGAGLTVLVAVAEIRGNLADEFTGALPAQAPSFFFIDIQPADLGTFEAALNRTGAAHDLQIMPSLRARILAVRGIPVAQFHPSEQTAWPLRSDIGFSYAASPPPGTVIATGKWWAPDYLGPPMISFDAAIARAWGLRIGDSLTVNVLGRRFNLKIANLRNIGWQTLQLNFLMVGTPDPFSAAPHTIIATVKADPGQEGAVLAAVTDALPGVTGIDVGQVLRALAGLLGQIGTAISVVALLTLLTGGLVLVSAIAAEREARIAEAIVLRTLGASQAQIRRAWLTEFAVAGGVAGLVAAALGTLAASMAIRLVFHIDWNFQPGVMLATIPAGIVAMLALGYASTARALRKPAAARLRLETGG